jgi:hypothetical protein
MDKQWPSSFRPSAKLSFQCTPEGTKKRVPDCSWHVDDQTRQGRRRKSLCGTAGRSRFGIRII